MYMLVNKICYLKKKKERKHYDIVYFRKNKSLPFVGLVKSYIC